MIFMLGIKGAGMAALACMLHELGEHVEDSDLEKHFFTEARLHELGIPVHPFGTFPPDGATIIMGNAFKDDFEDIVELKRRGTYTFYRYHEYLGALLNDYVGVAITGSHGKTTTTKMVTSMLQAHKPTAYLIGDGHGHLASDSHYMAIEADEYRRFFLAYHPKYAVITNVDYDHVDYYKDALDYASAYEQFAHNVTGALFVYGDDPEVRKLNLSGTVYTYGLEPNNDLVATIDYEDAHETRFRLNFKGKDLGSVRVPFSGRHLIWNALGCIGIGLLENIPLSVIEEGLGSFENAARRFKVEVNGSNIYIDDYAHHPTEVKTTLETARKRWPDKKIVAVFKPHRVSRVKYFAQQFADALSIADKVGVCDFTSIDDFEPGIDITIDYLSSRIKDCKVYQETEQEAKELAKEAPCVYVFMSSKDIYPFKEKVKKDL